MKDSESEKSTNEIKTFFAVSIKKIEGTDNDYEQILSLNTAFQVLSQDEISKIEDIVSKAVEDVQTVLRLRKKE